MRNISRPGRTVGCEGRSNAGIGNTNHGTMGGGIDDFDRAIIDFVLVWEPYGGPPHDEVLPRFGLLSHELPDRVREIVYRGLRAELSSRDRILLARGLNALNHNRLPEGYSHCRQFDHR